MVTDLEYSLRKWAEQSLEGIGVNKDKIPNFEELRAKVIEGLRATYSTEVLAFSLEPRNLRDIPDHDGFARLTGSCGDTMEIYLIIENSIIKEVKFFTSGCASTQACGSLTTELAKNKNV